ncbi:MAG: SpoIVB peptidase [Firmicutes bacterium ZCTH02-B6]|nr:MAG: SpoIVB peptidase [Firmicutes bacterium ZCTH02-B6]
MLCLLLALSLSVQVRDAFRVPAEVRLLPGQEFALDLGRFLTLVDVSSSGWLVQADTGLPIIRAADAGGAQVQVRFLGVLPLRTVQVMVVPRLAVVPGGQAIGVMVSSRGLVISQTMQLVDVDGVTRFPARDAGLRPGDILVEMAGTPLYTVDQVHALVERFGRRGEPLEVVVARNGVLLTRTIVPVPVEVEEGGERAVRYRLGLRLESPAAGIGTLTFYDPTTMRFAGLGHMITDGSRNPIEVNEGRIVEAIIRGVQQGARGFPGEKIGVFDGQAGDLGTIEKNSRFGIYGHLERLPRWGLYDEPVPVALAHEVRPGPAEMLTVIDGRQVERFAVRIVQVQPHRRADGRGLVVEVTDERLLDRTRGIVQGMSGSPILQDGKLVGAVTHVFVNDPTRGYGILAEWMAYEAEIMPEVPDAGQESVGGGRS